jgi:type IV fimbrial biogenesis protein FimT
MKKQNGITLIELLITVVILGIMASIAVPNFSSFVRNSQRSAAYNSMAGTINLARLEAIKRSRVVVLCASPDQSTCATATNANWNDGWLVFVDNNGDGVLDPAADVVLKREAAGPPSISITSTLGSLISLAPRGRMRDQGTVLICDGTDATKAMALNLWVTGLGRLAIDSDGDGVVEDIAGNPVSCT